MTLEKKYNIFFVEKNDAQISRVAVVKKALSPSKKFFGKKILPAYLYR